MVRPAAAVTSQAGRARGEGAGPLKGALKGTLRGARRGAKVGIESASVTGDAARRLHERGSNDGGVGTASGSADCFTLCQVNKRVGRVSVRVNVSEAMVVVTHDVAT